MINAYAYAADADIVRISKTSLLYRLHGRVFKLKVTLFDCLWIRRVDERMIFNRMTFNGTTSISCIHFAET